VAAVGPADKAAAGWFVRLLGGVAS
jgi:hypothetical protein